MRELTRRELEDILVGCAILGCGGGGSLERGLRDVRAALRNGGRFRLAELAELPRRGLLGTPYYCGSLVALELPPVSPAKPRFEGKECSLAFDALAEHLGQKFIAAVASELGGGNTAAALVVAAKADLPLVDGDAAGRSVPDLQHSTYYVKGIPIAPMGVATKYGDVMILKEVADDFHAEAIVRAAAVASGGHVGVVDHPGSVGDLAAALVPKSITHAQHLGEAVREARDEGTSAPAAILAAGGGYHLFAGTVEGATYEDKAGFTLGEVRLRGKDDFVGQNYRIWYKNEHLMSWLDDKVDVTAPDLITIVGAFDGEPVLNPHPREGDEVWVLGFAAPRLWRTKKGVTVLGPRYFGFGVDYRPIEAFHKPWQG